MVRILPILALLVLANRAVAAPLRVCTFTFHSPHEVEAFRANLPPEAFQLIDLSPPPLAQATELPSLTPSATKPLTSMDPSRWPMSLCRADVQCDVVVVSGEFAGRFFGQVGTSLSLQEMEEAACQSRCEGLFRHPLEVFLMACNTLATKDQDRRTPEEYLQVLLQHGFDAATAARVVEIRYGPLGQSFRESLRRVFMGVPRVYGFSSVAPVGEVTAPMLQRYFATKGDYASYLRAAGRSTAANRELLTAFAGTGMVQTSGLDPLEARAADRGAICSVYDESRSVADRLAIIRGLMTRDDFLSFLPTIEVFFTRHEPAQMQGEDRHLFTEIQGLGTAREAVLRVVRDLDVSALKLEIAHLTALLEWMTRDEFRALAIDSARQLLRRALTSEVVDVMCEIARYEPIGDQFTSADHSPILFLHAEGLRLVDCLHTPDPAVTDRLIEALTHPDPSARLWAGYALTRRIPLTPDQLRRLAPHLQSDPAELRLQLRWIFGRHPDLPDDVRELVRKADAALAETLVGRKRFGLF